MKHLTMEALCRISANFGVPKIFELAIGTLKIESGERDLPPEGSKKRVVDKFAI